LFDLIRVAILPPEFRQIIAAEDHVLGSHVATSVSVCRHDERVAINQAVEKCGPEAMAFGLVHKEHLVLIIIITPEAGGLLGHDEIVFVWGDK